MRAAQQGCVWYCYNLQTGLNPIRFLIHAVLIFICTLFARVSWSYPVQAVIPHSTPYMAAWEALTELAQAHAAPAVLDAGPRERGVEVVAAVEEDGAGVELVDHVQERLLRGGVSCRVRPHGCSEPVRRVVHERDRLDVGRDLLDADHGSEGFFL